MERRSTGSRAGRTSTYSSSRRRSPSPYRPRELRDAHISPTKSLGQHFLTDHNVVAKIVAAAELQPDDLVIEVGPGMGVLTEALSAAAGRVIAVELDARLASHLRDKFPPHSNVTIVESDILSQTPANIITSIGVPDSVSPDVATAKLRDSSLRVDMVHSASSSASDASPSYVVVANLPYNIGAAVLRHFLEAAQPPKRLVVMLQREVASAITAAPGDLSLLGVATQVYAQSKRLFNVPAKAFYPPPKVVSSVIRLDVRPQPLVPQAERNRFFDVVRAGFSAPRKQLRNSLAQGLHQPPSAVLPAIQRAAIDPSLRPEDLSIDAWLRLSRTIEVQ